MVNISTRSLLLALQFIAQIVYGLFSSTLLDLKLPFLFIEMNVIEKDLRGWFFLL